jgi:cell division septum initiation protein DivIVA
LIEENKNLRNQVEQLDQQRRAAPVDTGKNLRPVGLRPSRVIGPIRPPIKEQTSCDDDHNVHAAKVLGLAQEMAERLTNEAKAEADGMLSKAHATSAQLLSEARAKAEGMVTGAKTRAETMLNDARTKAETRDGSPGTRPRRWSARRRANTPRSLVRSTRRRACWRRRSTN